MSGNVRKSVRCNHLEPGSEDWTWNINWEGFRRCVTFKEVLVEITKRVSLDGDEKDGVLGRPYLEVKETAVYVRWLFDPTVIIPINPVLCHTCTLLQPVTFLLMCFLPNFPTITYHICITGFTSLKEERANIQLNRYWDIIHLFAFSIHITKPSMSRNQSTNNYYFLIAVSVDTRFLDILKLAKNWATSGFLSSSITDTLGQMVLCTGEGGRTALCSVWCVEAFLVSAH